VSISEKRPDSDSFAGDVNAVSNTGPCKKRCKNPTLVAAWQRHVNSAVQRCHKRVCARCYNLVFLNRLCAMGFEQLAELKKQLAAARAEAAPAARSGAKPASKHVSNAASNPGAKPGAKAASKPGARPARKPAQPRRDANPAAAEAKPAVDAKPVDPVVKSIGRLQKRFPIAFPKNPAPKLPLKVGIFEDLVVHAKELSLSEAELRDAIKTWCRGSRYWKCLVEGAARVDLTGAEVGTVTAQESAGAQRLQAHRANRSAAKAAAASASAATPANAAEAAAPTAEAAGETASVDAVATQSAAEPASVEATATSQDAAPAAASTATPSAQPEA
jgi:ProP effector